MGMVSTSAKYGWRAVHFYWIGAVPAMLFLALLMMPIYYHSKVRSVPEFLKVRFGEPTRVFQCAFIRGAHSAGLGRGTVCDGADPASDFWMELRGGNGDLGRFCTGVYPDGRPAATMYNEVLQFALIVIGFAPLAWYSVLYCWGKPGHIWAGMHAVDPHAATMDGLGVIFGLDSC